MDVVASSCPDQSPTIDALNTSAFSYSSMPTPSASICAAVRIAATSGRSLFASPLSKSQNMTGCSRSPNTCICLTGLSLPLLCELTDAVDSLLGGRSWREMKRVIEVATAFGRTRCSLVVTCDANTRVHIWRARSLGRSRRLGGRRYRDCIQPAVNGRLQRRSRGHGSMEAGRAEVWGGMVSDGAKPLGLLSRSWLAWQLLQCYRLSAGAGPVRVMRLSG